MVSKMNSGVKISQPETRFHSEKGEVGIR